ncbi:MAG: HEAT repeat domain-containing protein, partial [Propionibacteriaceae bacterium]|nr:HEAT repeat domain-containing protein [Propionibacteriaceae bacterium]
MFSKKREIPGPVTEVFKGLRKQRAELAEVLEQFIALGERAVDVLNLQPDEWQTIEGAIQWARNLPWDTNKLVPEQWRRFGEVYSQLPSWASNPSKHWRPAGVPEWFMALQDMRGWSGPHREIWAPQWFEPVLDVEIPRPGQPHVVLRAFFSTLGSHYGAADNWNNTDAARPSAFLDYVLEHISQVEPALADAPADIRKTALSWLGKFPHMAPGLLPLVAEYGASSAKGVRDAALALLVALPEADQLQTLAAMIAAASTANVASAIDAAARLGEPGRAVLSAALAEGRGGKRDELLATALHRSEVAAAAPEAELDLPPTPPLEPPNLGDEFLARTKEAVARYAESTQKAVNEHPKYEYLRKRLSWVQSIVHSDLVSLRDYLNGAAPAPRFMSGRRDEVYFLVHDLVGKNLAANARLCLRETKNGVDVSPRINAACGEDYDWRTLLLVLEQVRPDAERMVSDIAFSWYGWNPPNPDLIWPFFVEHPERLDQALGLAAAGPKPSYWYVDQKAVALQILSYFPKLPNKYVPVLAELATGEARTYRGDAQKILEKQPDAVQFAIRALESSKQEVRAAAARWAAKLGKPEAVEPLRQAMAKEKREPVQAAMLSALRVLGDDISHHLTPEVLAASAKKGLAGKAPASMVWFPLDALPACRWADNTPVDPDIIRWWA